MEYPFNDNAMEYDFVRHQYVLTKEGVLNELNINLDEELNTAAVSNTANASKVFLERISTLVYNYLRQYNNSAVIEYIVAKCPSARDIIKRALQAQLFYVLAVGDLSLSPEIEKRKLAIDDNCKSILLNQVVEETGVVLTYIGRYMFAVPSYEQGGY